MKKAAKNAIFTLLVLLVLINISPMITRAEETIEIVDTSNHTYTYSEMAEDLYLLAVNYPGKFTYTSLGLTADNRPIYMGVIGNPNAEHAIYIHAAIHGREWLNTMMVMKQIETNLMNWDVSINGVITVGDLYNECAIYIIPMLNPDGVTISQYGINGIISADLKANIKNMSGSKRPKYWKANACGVDLNRNFSNGWYEGSTKVSSPASSGYRGVAPFTEAETIAVRDVINSRNFDVAISYHSYEGAIYWYLGQEGELLEKSTILSSKVQNLTGYTLAESDPPHGLDYNYFILDMGIPTVLIETGTVSCPLPYSQWPTLWNRNKDIIFGLALEVAYGQLN